MLMRILMFPAMVLIMLYCVIALIMPTMQNINAEKQSALVKMGERDAAQKRLSAVQAVMRSVEEHKQESEFISSFLPNDKREEILISDISQLAEKSSVSLFTVGFSDGGKERSSDEIEVSDLKVIGGEIEITGTYENVKKFVAELLHMKRLYAFKSIELTKVSQESVEGEEVSQNQNLSGTLSFAYGYVPGKVMASPSEVQRQIDYDNIKMIMNAGSQTVALKSESQIRVNPFLP